MDAVEQRDTKVILNITVLLIGETGVGKERFAEYLHQKSARRFKPLVKVGKGAFTGAVSEKKGLFETANGGTLFLDDKVGTKSRHLRESRIALFPYYEVKR